MKKITFLTFLGFILLLADPSQAQSPIAVQNNSGTSFYSTLDLAITNAISGDYIYLPGGSFNVTVPISKQLHIIGVGHNPDSCAVTGITQVSGTFSIRSGSDGGSISGLKIIGQIQFYIGTTENNISNYTIERCNIGSTITLSNRISNLLINECIIIEGISGNSLQGFQLSKCIIGRYIIGFDSNAYFLNNIFFGNVSCGSNVSIQGAFFKNNIFLSPLTEGTINGVCVAKSQFQNNLFNAGCYYVSNSTNTYQNNITGPVSTLFVNQSGTVFDYKQDYHIKTDSPAHNAGTDGTDLGIYGTGNPWKEGSLPSNPHIQSKSISTINGNLNVKIKVVAQDY